jgi:hypothetical protein
VRIRGCLALLGLLSLACGATSQEATSPYANYGSSSVVPPAWDPHDQVALGLPSGQQCLGWLDTLGISHRPLDELRGVDTPVEVVGPISGVRYMTEGKPSVVGDCRLILALDWASRTLTRVGIDEVRHSGAYVYRTTSSGRPSLHARGLAIDVHAVRSGSTWFDVERDYEHGSGPSCDSVTPFLNHVYCRLRQLQLFRELITPDHNAEHHDHFHLGIAPLR